MRARDSYDCTRGQLGRSNVSIPKLKHQAIVSCSSTKNRRYLLARGRRRELFPLGAFHGFSPSSTSLAAALLYESPTVILLFLLINAFFASSECLMMLQDFPTCLYHQNGILILQKKEEYHTTSSICEVNCKGYISKVLLKNSLGHKMWPYL